VSTLLSIDSAATQRTDLFPVDLSATTESSLALVGQWHALFQVLTGEIAVNKRSICVAGLDARDQVTSGMLGVMPSRFAWPDGHTVEQLLQLSAGLLGMSGREASSEAQRVMQQLQLLPLRQQKVAKLLPLQMRSVALAHALLGSPRCLAIEDALLGLTTQESRLFLETLRPLQHQCALIVNVAHATAGCVERMLVEHCDEVLILDRGAITLQGSPSQLTSVGMLFQMTITGAGIAEGGQSLRAALQERGVVVRSFATLADSAAGASVQGPAARLVVELGPDAATLPLFAAAKSCNSTLLDLRALPNLEK
jgi:ABC-type multidrug transport system ATPase subunit